MSIELEEYNGIMRRWLPDGFECPICNGYFYKEEEARKCKASHDRILAIGQRVYVIDSVTHSGSHNESDWSENRERPAIVVNTELLRSLLEFDGGGREWHNNKQISLTPTLGK